MTLSEVPEITDPGRFTPISLDSDSGLLVTSGLLPLHHSSCYYELPAFYAIISLLSVSQAIRLVLLKD
jgi:hypothetical protein